jgi:hypothetical protein
MMGSKVRVFAPVEHLSLEELVPQDHFHRQLERVLDLVAPGRRGGGLVGRPLPMMRRWQFVSRQRPSGVETRRRASRSPATAVGPR